MPRAPRTRTESVQTDALLVRRVPYGEADLIVTVFTEQRGVLTALARSGLRSTKRFSALEPMHLLEVVLDEKPGSEALAVLREARIVRPRLHLIADLGRIEAAGRALRWIRAMASAQTADRSVWDEVNQLLDQLDSRSTVAPPEAPLATSGLRLLAAFGWALQLTECVRCGRPCAETAPAYVDPVQGGLVCRMCGRGSILLQPKTRAHMIAAANNSIGAMPMAEATITLDLIEQVLAAHAGATFTQVK